MLAAGGSTNFFPFRINPHWENALLLIAVQLFAFMQHRMHSPAGRSSVFGRGQDTIHANPTIFFDGPVGGCFTEKTRTDEPVSTLRLRGK